MKSQKGITLISVTIYVIGMTVLIAIISIISSYFYSNVDLTSKNIDPLVEYTKFNSYFTEAINHDNIKVLECKENYVAFDNGKQYTFIPENKGIYENKVKICRNAEYCKFDYSIKNGKNVVEVTVKITNGEEKTIQYTLKN